MFPTVFALAGDHAPDLWLLVARAGGLLALVMAYRVAALLAGRFAGAMAAAGLLLTERWLRDTTLSNSEPLLVALVLWAVSEHLTGRRGRALALGFGAGLLRPEIWPFLGLYGLFLWFREPRWRARMAGLALLMPILWFLPEALGSGDALRASTRARTPNPDSPAFAPRPALEILRLFWPLTIAPVKAGAVAGVVLALVAYVRRRRHGATLALAAGGLAWLGLVAVMTEAGYAGNVRYLMLAAAIFCVVAGIGFASMAEALGHLAGGGRRGRVAAAAALTAVAAVLAVPRATWLVGDAIDLNLEAELYDDIPVAVARAGGAERLLDCGRPFTGPYQVPSIAWHLHVHTSTVTHIPQPRGVAFRPRPGSGENPRFGVPKAPFRRLASSTKWDVFAACDPGWSKARRRFEASAGASAGRLASRR